MRYAGSSEFVASSDRVFALLIDPTRFGPCTPVPITRIDDTHYRVATRIGAGLFSATIALALEVVDIVAGSGARIVGRGGTSGTTIEGAATFRIRPGTMDGTTLVDWEVEIVLAGGLAGIASRMIDERAQGAIDQLIGCIQRQVEA